MSDVVIELKVHNHQGVISRVTVLVTRRFLHIEGVLCGPGSTEPVIRMYILVRDNGRLGQVIRFLETSYDVQEVCIRYDLDRCTFERINELCHNDDLERPLVSIGGLATEYS